MSIQQIKQRFGIIGNSPDLYRAIDIAVQVAATDLSVLINGESGVGKEFFPQIIHSLSSRKHNSYIAVNCGAIPEGTIDSELFGHEKGSFTGATDSRKGYFEVADKGTIFLDEIAELPISTQVRLLRVLETGEFIKVGSSKVIKTNVRVIAATNVNLLEAVNKNKFREDLLYRLNTVPIMVPPLRKRKEDIHLLFRKFAINFSEKYRMPPITLTPDAVELLENYWWRGNIRQLKNITEQISIIEEERLINFAKLKQYLPDELSNRLPALYKDTIGKEEFSSEREILYKILFDMRNEINELKSIVTSVGTKTDKAFEIREQFPSNQRFENTEEKFIENNNTSDNFNIENFRPNKQIEKIEDTEEIIEESLSLKDKEIELIRKALDKHKGKRKYAAEDLGISERTLYRKIKDYDLEN